MSCRTNVVRSVVSAALLATQASGLQLVNGGAASNDVLGNFLGAVMAKKGLAPELDFGKLMSGGSGFGDMFGADSEEYDEEPLTPQQIAEQKRLDEQQYAQERINGEFADNLARFMESTKPLQSVSCLSDVVYAFDAKHEMNHEKISTQQLNASKAAALKCVGESAQSAAVEFVDVVGVKCVAVKRNDGKAAWADCAGMRKAEVSEFMVKSVPNSMRDQVEGFLPKETFGHVREPLFAKLLGADGKVAFPVERSGAELTSKAVHDIASGVFARFVEMGLHSARHFQLSGHSLGGGIAQVVYSMVMHQQYKKRMTLFTFAAPPVWNEEMEEVVEMAERKNRKSQRFQFINEGDFVGKLTKRNLEAAQGMLAMFGSSDSAETDLDTFRGACYAPDSYTGKNLTLPSPTRMEGGMMSFGVKAENHSLPAYQAQLAFVEKNGFAIKNALAARKQARMAQEQARAEEQLRAEAYEQEREQHLERQRAEVHRVQQQGHWSNLLRAQRRHTQMPSALTGH